MFHHRLAALLTPVSTRAARRWRALRDDRGSYTTDAVLWIGLTMLVALAAYQVFQSKILAKIASLDLG